MTRCRLAIAWIVFAAGAVFQPARAEPPTGTSPIPGYFDPRTRTFTATGPAPSSAADTKAATSTQAAVTPPKLVRGTITLKATITAISTIPAGTDIRGYAYVMAGSYDGDPRQPHAHGIAGTNTLTVTRSGSTITAVASFHYQMAVDPNSALLNANMLVSVNTSTPTQLSLQRQVAIPTNGATTTITFTGRV